MDEKPFNPIRTKPGEFRVALNLTALGDKAWEVLACSQQLGFEQPQFKTFILGGVAEAWAIVLQQFHDYEADPDPIIEPWDDKTSALWDAVGENPESKIIIAYKFKAFLEQVKAA